MAFLSPPPVVTFTTSIRLHDRFEAMTEPGLEQIRLAPLLEHIERVGAVIYAA
jgi:hypothetical protein